MAMLLPESLSAALAADAQANTEKKKKVKNRKIKSIIAWTECFLTYMGGGSSQSTRKIARPVGLCQSNCACSQAV